MAGRPRRPERVPPPRAFAAFGAGSWVVPPAQVTGAERMRIGQGVVVLELAAVDVGPGATLSIGDGCRVGRGCAITATTSVTIGRAVGTGDHVCITDTWVGAGPAANAPQPAAPVVIGDGAYLAFGSFIGPGVQVGEGAYVGEGAVVLDDVAAHTVVRGNPARAAAR